MLCMGKTGESVTTPRGNLRIHRAAFLIPIPKIRINLTIEYSRDYVVNQ